MITVTSAEKQKIEGQMKTALPYLNEQLDFNLDLINGSRGRSILTFKQGEEVFELPIFYITPSTDDSAWELLTDRIEDERYSQGVFFIRFNSEQHLIQNAATYALTNADLYQKNMFSEICRLCSYVDLDPYQVQLFDVAEVSSFFKKLIHPQMDTEKESKAMEPNEDETVNETVKISAQVNEETETKEAVVEEAVAEKAPEKEAAKETKQAAVKETVCKPSADTKKETAVKPVTKEEDVVLDSDIRALINDCFGIF